VVECRRNPGCGVVASLALLRKTGLRVIGICSAVEILNVATVAVGRRALEFSADVAGRAFQSRVRSGERKSREFQVIELRVVPSIGAMASLAGAGKIQRLVVRIYRFLKISRVAGDASRR